MKKLFMVIVLAAIVFVGWFVWQKQNPQTTSSNKQGDSSQQGSFNKKQFSLTDPNSIWVVANKHNQLKPANYAPKDLITPDVPLRLGENADEMKMRREAAQALEVMFTAAGNQGLHLQISSAYRSFSYQTNLYNHYVDVQGKAVADSQSARPGYSEHQTGLAVDVEPTSRKCEVEECFADTPEGQWIATNAYRYGYFVRYPKDMQNVTGYIYEPWHIRYVGQSLAAEMHKDNVATLEQFFGLGNAPDYE
jgi:D-alanyl-D-alanine carboxypeptidase